MADDQERFIVPLPGGRVARVPLSVLEKYVDAAIKSSHAGELLKAMTTLATRDGKIAVHVYANRGEVAVMQQLDSDDEDVVAHSMSVDASTGTSQWHTDWELGQCEYTDESGYPRSAYAWHRHPFGTEYTEIYEG